MPVQIDVHVGGVNDLAFSHPNKQLCVIVCGDDKTIKVWDAATCYRQYTFQGHKASVYSVSSHYKENIQATSIVLIRPISKSTYGMIEKVAVEWLWLELVWLFDWWGRYQVGTNVGDIGLWKIATKERMILRNFKVWDLNQCTTPLQSFIVPWTHKNSVNLPASSEMRIKSTAGLTMHRHGHGWHHKNFVVDLSIGMLCAKMGMVILVRTSKWSCLYPQRW